MNTNITPPVVHLNGSGKTMLVEGYDAAATALEEFIGAWGRIEFNARDYYPSGPEAWSNAREHRDQIAAKIREINDYILAHRIHLHKL